MNNDIPYQLNDEMEQIFSPSELNSEVRDVLESQFGAIWIQGEISNLSKPRSGHWYFSIKDDNAAVRCAMFRMHNQRLDFVVEDGMEVLLQGRVSLYVARGDFQLIINYIEPGTTGKLRRQFEILKHKLTQEGLFDSKHKSGLPAYPRNIGIISSATGAALQDILHVLKRRYPVANVWIYAVAVQGGESEKDIAKALSFAPAKDLPGEKNGTRCDVLILARGGGSLEDLQAFNSESVARAVHTCPIPIVTGVGHETDFTICDMVADVRAPTPSAAAEIVTPDGSQLASYLGQLHQRANTLLNKRIMEEQETFEWLKRRLKHPKKRLQEVERRLLQSSKQLGKRFDLLVKQKTNTFNSWSWRINTYRPEPAIDRLEVKLTATNKQLMQSINNIIREKDERIYHVSKRLQALAPAATLKRGYAIVWRQQKVSPIQTVEAAKAGHHIVVELQDGSLESVVESVVKK